MQIMVNSKSFELPERCTVGVMLDLLGIQGRIAVEVNETIITRSQHPVHALQAGDRVEIVRAIGGG